MRLPDLEWYEWAAVIFLTLELFALYVVINTPDDRKPPKGGAYA